MVTMYTICLIRPTKVNGMLITILDHIPTRGVIPKFAMNVKLKCGPLREPNSNIHDILASCKSNKTMKSTASVRANFQISKKHFLHKYDVLVHLVPQNLHE